MLACMQTVDIHVWQTTVSMYAIISLELYALFVFTKLMRTVVDNCKLYASFHGLAVIADIDFESDL